MKPTLNPTINPVVAAGQLLLLLMGLSLFSACDSSSSSSCTEIESDPFLSPIVFDGTSVEQSILGWGPTGVFSFQDASDLKMRATIEDQNVARVLERADTDAFVKVRLVGGGETKMNLIVQNECGQVVELEVSIVAELPLGRVSGMCESRPSGKWLDYWPLEEGNRWVFSYEGRESDVNGGFRMQGEAVINVLSSSCANNLATHVAIAEYDYIIFLSTNPADANRRVVFADSLIIGEDPLGELRISKFTEVDQIRVREMVLNRYHEDGSDDILEQHQVFGEVGTSQSTILVQKSIGPFRITAGSAVNLFTQDVRFNLIDHFVASEQ